MKTTERAELNEKNCIAAASQLMYTLCALGVLKEPFSKYAYGHEVKKEHSDEWKSIIIQIASDVLMYSDEITNYGHVLGDVDEDGR